MSVPQKSVFSSRSSNAPAQSSQLPSSSSYDVAGGLLARASHPTPSPLVPICAQLANIIISQPPTSPAEHLENLKKFYRIMGVEAFLEMLDCIVKGRDHDTIAKYAEAALRILTPLFQELHQKSSLPYVVALKQTIFTDEFLSPFKPGECFHILAQCQRKLPITPRDSQRIKMLYLDLRATLGTLSTEEEEEFQNVVMLQMWPKVQADKTPWEHAPAIEEILSAYASNPKSSATPAPTEASKNAPQSQPPRSWSSSKMEIEGSPSDIPRVSPHSFSSPSGGTPRLSQQSFSLSFSESASHPTPSLQTQLAEIILGPVPASEKERVELSKKFYRIMGIETYLEMINSLANGENYETVAKNAMAALRSLNALSKELHQVPPSLLITALKHTALTDGFLSYFEQGCRHILEKCQKKQPITPEFAQQLKTHYIETRVKLNTLSTEEFEENILLFGEMRPVRESKKVPWEHAPKFRTILSESQLTQNSIAADASKNATPSQPRPSSSSAMEIDESGDLGDKQVSQQLK